MYHMPKLTKQFYAIVEEDVTPVIKNEAIVFIEFIVYHVSLNKTNTIIAQHINQVVALIKQQYPINKKPQIFRNDLKYVSISVKNKHKPILQMWL